MWRFSLIPLSLAIATLVSGCSVPERTAAIHSGSADPPHVTRLDDSASDGGTLLVVSASGGGTRAAALTLGTLQALDAVQLPGNGRTLADEIDIISSVSGGSVTAAQFALRGSEGFADLDQNFIRQNGISALAWRLLNPANAIRLPTNSYSRLDPLIGYLEDTLFAEQTFAALQGRRPYLLLNAADMSGGNVFTFTQPQFDLLCSDLQQFRIADAVAASAAFPVALAPLAIRNHAPCDWQLDKAALETNPGTNAQLRWPPVWLQNAVATDIAVNPDRVRRGRTALSYLNLDCGYPFDATNCAPLEEAGQRNWIHLLDGGIADNLGLAEPIRLISSVDVSPRLLKRIFSGDITRIGFVVVNARSEADTNLDQSGATPGVVSMLNATTGSAIDAASFGMLDRLGSVIRELLLLQAGDIARLRQKIEGLDFFVVAVDFDYIPDPACRRYFKNIATSWTLPDEDITALYRVARALVHQSEGFDRLLNAYGVDGIEQGRFSEACGDHRVAQS